LILRKSDPQLVRPFRTPWVPVVPILGIIVCVLMMASLPIVSWERLAIWMALGIAIYYAYSKKHSKIRNEYNGTLK